MRHKLQDGGSGVLAQTIDTEVAVLALAAETNLEENVWLSPKGGMRRDPAVTVLALMLDAQIAWFDSVGHYEASD